MEGDWLFLLQIPDQVVWVLGYVENQCISDLGVMVQCWGGEVEGLQPTCFAVH